MSVFVAINYSIGFFALIDLITKSVPSVSTTPIGRSTYAFGINAAIK